MEEDKKDFRIVASGPYGVTALITPPDGCDLGRHEAAEAFTNALFALRAQYPGDTFQLLPFAQETYRDGTSALSVIFAVAMRKPPPQPGHWLDMPVTEFFSKARFLELGLQRAVATVFHRKIQNLCFELKDPDTGTVTMRQFLATYPSVSALGGNPCIDGPGTVKAVTLAMRSAGIQFPD